VPTEKDRSSPLRRLRAEYPLFVYEDYEWRQDARGTLDCSFRFRAGEITFQPTCQITFTGPCKLGQIDREVMDNLVFHLGLAELPSYWKATCSPRVEVRTGSLHAQQAAFWTWILTDGMGEFHFANRTPFTDPDFVTITSESQRAHAVFGGRLERGHVLPVGGGKDSLVTLDLLGQRSEEIATIAINPPPSTESAIRLADVADSVVVHRRLDPRLLELNKAGFLNGHTPFGAVIGFLSALAAVLLGRKHIALSNESSSDYSTLVYRGRIINHQFGKSWALEAAMHRYIAEHVATDLHYFSLLRPFGELPIAQRFSELTGLHSVFRSCNRGRKTDTWCGRCPKCLSTFLVLAPFMARPELIRIFGKDLLLDPECQSILLSLLSEDGALRPFECVATPAEIRAALDLCGGERLAGATLETLTHRSANHLVPEALYKVADSVLRPRVKPLLGRALRASPPDGPASGPKPPRSARALVGVLGLGREGTSTCHHLLSTLPDLDLTVLDDDASAALRVPAAKGPLQQVRFLSGAQILGSCPELDILFKSPGVPPDHPAITALRRRPSLVTSNTELFFEERVGKVIGVTGTKGKSTTTSLIAHVLSAAGRDARLIGNIGRPCLDGLGGGDPRTIYCVELSSFQLENLRAGVDIAVVLGLFGDHLDRYGDMASYVAAKSSITRYQTRQDVVMYNADCPRATAIAGLSVGRRMPFGRARPDLLGDSPGPLLGEFNNYNLWPAVLIGRLFGIADAEIAASIRSFRALPGRLEEVADKDGVRFVCDIRSTAPEVTVAALEALSGNGEDVDFLFLGGVDRQQDYSTLLPALERSAVRHIVLFPPTGARIRALLESTKLMDRLALFEPQSMEEAIRYVYLRAPAARAVCLMSTAAPSNGGLFSGPEDKARQFADWATRLGRRESSG
jgi:UDP-N-acetylmuramoylalanine--D-glutamate ligase